MMYLSKIFKENFEQMLRNIFKKKMFIEVIDVKLNDKTKLKIRYACHDEMMMSRESD